MTLNAIYRQGDVLVFETDEPVPTEAKVVKRDVRGWIVLALGEQTGHTHAILDRDVELLSVADQVDRWLRVGAHGATVVHEEHAALSLPPGDYCVRIQRSYAPDAIRNQAD